MSFLSKYKYLLLFSLAALAYLGLTNNFNLCHDEIFSLKLLDYSWSKMLSIIVVQDGHPPLFYILLRLWMSFTDYTNVFWARLFPMTWLFALAALGPFLVKRLFNSNLAFLYTLIVLCAPASFFLATYVRMYAMAIFFITASFLYANLIVRDNKKSDWVKFFICALAGMYTHYLATLSIGVIYAVLFFRLIFQYKKNIIVWRRFFITAFATGICFAPWLLIFLNQTQNMYQTWYPKIEDTLRSAQFLSYHSFDFAMLKTMYGLNTVIFANGGLFFMILFFVVRFLTTKHSSEESMVFYPFLAIAGAYFTAFAVSFVLRPILTPSYLFFFITPLYLIWAHLTCQNKTFLITFLLLFIPLSVTAYVLRLDVVHAPTYRLLKNELDKLPPNTTITCTDAHACFYLMFYAPQHNRSYYPLLSQLVVLPDEIPFSQKTQAELVTQPTYLFSSTLDKKLCPEPLFDLYYKRSFYCLYTPQQAQQLFPHMPLYMGDEDNSASAH